jgi:hypothetical protein
MFQEPSDLSPPTLPKGRQRFAIRLRWRCPPPLPLHDRRPGDAHEPAQRHLTEAESRAELLDEPSGEPGGLDLILGDARPEGGRLRGALPLPRDDPERPDGAAKLSDQPPEQVNFPAKGDHHQANPAVGPPGDGLLDRTLDLRHR